MKWMLIVITFVGGLPVSIDTETFNTAGGCYEARIHMREQYAETLRQTNATLPDKSIMLHTVCKEVYDG